MRYKASKCHLLELLKTRNMSQSEFARRMHMQRQQVYRYIKLERVMSLEMAVAAAATLECDIKDLYDFEIF